MNPLEIAGLILACVSGIALPAIAARNKRIKDLEDKVAAQAVTIAKIETASEMWCVMHEDLRSVNTNVQKMAESLARLEGTLSDRNHN